MPVKPLKVTVSLRVNHYDFVALHSMWIIFLKGLCILVRVEIIHKSEFLPGTVEKNSSTIRSSGKISDLCIISTRTVSLITRSANRSRQATLPQF